MKTLEADRLMRADKVFARVCRQNLDVSKNISAREIGVRRVPDAVADCFHHSAIDDVKNIAEITRGVNCLPRCEVPGLRELAESLQLKWTGSLLVKGTDKMSAQI